MQGRFVNGSIGEVVDFMTMSEAHAKQIPVGTPSISKSEVLMGIERQNDHHYTLLLEGEERWPLVNFHGYEMLCVPRTFTALTEDSEMLIAQRIQVSLYRCARRVLLRVAVFIGAFDFSVGSHHPQEPRADTFTTANTHR